MVLLQLDLFSSAVSMLYYHALLSAVVGGLVVLLLVRSYLFKVSKNPAKSIAFFHPYANTCGGGERVLWIAVKAMEESDIPVTIYTGDIEPDEDILKRCLNRFNIILKNKPRFVRLKRRNLLEASAWPRFTMLGQSFGSMIVALEALWQFVPDVFIDTTGCAFTLPLAKLCGCRTAAYVHYPTISEDMLKRVAERRPTYNNDGAITSSTTRTFVKLWYYRFFAYAYSWAGFFCDVVMVNSSWTGGHVRSLWKRTKSNTHVVYPPCDTTRLQKLPIDGKERERVVVSISQFRPEKDQRRQIAAMKILLKERSDRKKFQDVRLVMIGSCRNKGDEALANGLEVYAKECGVADNVELRRNVTWDELVSWLGRAEAGMHTMWNEHFGIGVVEMQAAGAIPIAHNSAGPQMDIVVPSFQTGAKVGNDSATGFLAVEPEEYAEAMANVFSLSPAKKSKIRTNARSHASERFSEELFEKKFRDCMSLVL